MFFGDGDGSVLTQTTAGIDVIGHELTHGVTQYEANLVYSGQSGALNESVSDVFGIQVKQYLKGESAQDSNWLIGEDIVGPELTPRCARCRNPGRRTSTTTSRPAWRLRRRRRRAHQLGHPEPGLLRRRRHAGWESWDAAGPIWYAALCDPSLPATATFSDFAKRTLIQAERAYGAQSGEADAVRKGWDDVEVPV